MRIKSVVTGVRRRSITPSTASPIPLLSTTNDDHNATFYNSNSDDNHHTHNPFPDSVPETVPVDSLDDNICITCNKLGGELLVCSQTDCPVSVHVTCIGSEPKFDDSGNFLCPYCAYKRALKKTRDLREKAILAKKALSSFLDENQTVHKDKEEQPVEPEPETVQDHVNRNEPEANEPDVDEPKVSHSEEENDEEKVSVSGSSVSETKDSDYEVSVAEKKVRARVKRKAAPVKKALLRERKTDGGGGGGGSGSGGGGGGSGSGGGDDVDEEEVTSSRTSSVRNRVTKQNMLTGKRKRLNWTAEEEKVLKEGVLKFATEDQNIPWRNILEFGCRVFDKTRTPVDLKDKWRKITSKQGCK